MRVGVFYSLFLNQVTFKRCLTISNGEETNAGSQQSQLTWYVMPSYIYHYRPLGLVFSLILMVDAESSIAKMHWCIHRS